MTTAAANLQVHQVHHHLQQQTSTNTNTTASESSNSSSNSNSNSNTAGKTQKTNSKTNSNSNSNNRKSSNMETAVAVKEMTVTTTTDNGGGSNTAAATDVVAVNDIETGTPTTATPSTTKNKDKEKATTTTGTMDITTRTTTTNSDPLVGTTTTITTTDHPTTTTGAATTAHTNDHPNHHSHDGGISDCNSSVGNGNGNGGGGSSSNASTTSSSFRKNHTTENTSKFIAIILILGGSAAAAFMGLGISSARQQQQDEFQRVAQDTVRFVQAAFEDYVHACSLVHARCRHFQRQFPIPNIDTVSYYDDLLLETTTTSTTNTTTSNSTSTNTNTNTGRTTFQNRKDFTELHEYLVSMGLQYKAVQFDPNVTNELRPIYEAEANAYYGIHYPDLVDYQGIRGFNELDSSGGLQIRTEQPFHFPVHYMEPVEGNVAAIGLDIYSSESRIRAINAVFTEKGPSMTDRLSLVRDPVTQKSRCGNFDLDVSYGIVLLHPGIPLENPQENDELWPKDLSSMVICIPDLLQRATEASNGNEASYVYIHDQSTPDYVSTEPVFMGGVKVLPHYHNDNDNDDHDDDENHDHDDTVNEYLLFLDEVPFSTLGEQNSNKHKNGLSFQRNVPVANRVWTVTVQAVEGTYKPTNITFVIVGGIIIFCSSVALALWLHTHSNRMVKLQQVQAQADAERASLILSGARKAAKAERELNDFIAHEIRNPVAAAMAATNFIKLELEEKEPLREVDALETAREDVGIVENALKFVNDLLRNMLDMHRASTKQLQVTMATTDLLHDVMEPVGGMLYQRGSKVRLIVDCPPDLYVRTDALRLKQVLMNLGRNSSKFIDTGYIRLKAEIVDDGTNVHLYVDDSGCGIPAEKQRRLFAKYQESLDLLNQGTGIGLYLCKLLVELMGGEIGLDNEYDSGIPGHPGARFVVNLQSPPLPAPHLPWAAHHHHETDHQNKKTFKYTQSLNGQQLMVKAGGGNGGPQDDDDSDGMSLPYELPENLNVLFVDDDAIIRKLFTRAIKQLAPQWNVREAASGESALRLVEEAIADAAEATAAAAAAEAKTKAAADNGGEDQEQEQDEEEGTRRTSTKSNNTTTTAAASTATTTKKSSSSSLPTSSLGGFDVIFIDMYMASVEKQMLGTDTVRALRQRGITCRLCGLSANDKELEFIQAGADAFLVKPFSCDKPTMSQELCRVLYGDYQKDGGYFHDSDRD